MRTSWILFIGPPWIFSHLVCTAVCHCWLNNWPQDCYASVLHAMLVGKGLKVFAELSTEDCKDYSILKAALLNAYTVVSEVHRSRFRNRMKQPTET